MLFAGRRALFRSGGRAMDGSSGPVPGTNASNFLARTSGLDTTHRNAYINFINGLDTDSLFSKFDLIHLYAAQDSTNGLLNLIQNAFNGTANGSPTFTTDRGFTGVDNSSTVYIDTGFNPTTASSPQYTQNSAHLSFWNLTNAANANPSFGFLSASTDSYVYAKYSGDNTAYFRPNSPSNSGINISVSDPRGHTVGNRTDSTHIQGYNNGTSLVTSNAAASNTLPNFNCYALGCNNKGTALGAANQIAMISVGSSLSSTDVSNFYSRLRTYMTAVGVP